MQITDTAVSWYQWTDATYDFTINVDNSYIEGGTSSIDLGSVGTKNYGTTNISSGLYFVDAANGDYSLSPVSTLLGSGMTSRNSFFIAFLTALTYWNRSS